MGERRKKNDVCYLEWKSVPDTMTNIIRRSLPHASNSVNFEGLARAIRAHALCLIAQSAAS